MIRRIFYVLQDFYFAVFVYEKRMFTVKWKYFLLSCCWWNFIKQSPLTTFNYCSIFLINISGGVYLVFSTMYCKVQQLMCLFSLILLYFIFHSVVQNIIIIMITIITIIIIRRIGVNNNNNNNSSSPFFMHALFTLLVLVDRNAHASRKQLAKKAYINRKFSLKENKKNNKLKKKW